MTITNYKYCIVEGLIQSQPEFSSIHPFPLLPFTLIDTTTLKQPTKSSNSVLSNQKVKKPKHLSTAKVRRFRLQFGKITKTHFKGNPFGWKGMPPQTKSLIDLPNSLYLALIIYNPITKPTHAFQRKQYLSQIVHLLFLYQLRSL